MVMPKHRVVMSREKHPSITLDDYIWVDGEVGSFYSQYLDKVKAFFTLSIMWNICPFVPEWCLCEAKLGVLRKWEVKKESGGPSGVPVTEVVLMRDFFCVYDCIFCDLQVEISFDKFTMSVLRVLNVAPL